MKKNGLKVLIAMVTALMAVSCVTGESGLEEVGDNIPVTFTMSTPAGEAVPYTQNTRATHDEAEWTIHKLSLYVYAVDDDDQGTFLRSYSTDAEGDRAISIVPNGAGTYTFTLQAPVSDLKSRQRFVFVANDAFTDPEVGESQDELQNKLATTVLEANNTADKLAPADSGIAMSGIAESQSNDVITIVPGVKCEVHLKRIVARIDVQNNTPNMVINSITLQNAAPKGFLFPHTPVTAADKSYITENMNTATELGSSYAEQTDLKKVFYLYERPNSEENGATVKVTYTINNSKGEVEIPFRKTSDGKEYVDITRNTLYTIILGDGTPIVTNEVKFSIKVDDWNVVDMDESVDPDEDAQAALNATLKVNMFTPFNAKEFDLSGKTITAFYDKLTNMPENVPESSYVTWQDLSDNGALDAEFTGPDGQKYRIPTAGECALLLPLYIKGHNGTVNKPNDGWYHPYWNDNPISNTFPYVTVETPFTETIYLKNDGSHKFDSSQPDDASYTLSGETQLKVGAQTRQVIYKLDENLEAKPYNIHIVYGLRFKGTDQYAAYRWEYMPISGEADSYYLSIRIKALGKDDVSTTIDDIAQEPYWKKGYIEFTIPASGRYSYNEDDTYQLYRSKTYGFIWSTTTNEDGSKAYALHTNNYNATLDLFLINDNRHPLRFVKISE